MLKVYEIGAGNGTLMMNILDYIKTHEPAIYSSAVYNVIEISPMLAKIQRKFVLKSLHSAKVNIINKSIFAWDQSESDLCYIVAMEVIVMFYLRRIICRMIWSDMTCQLMNHFKE